MPKKYTQEEIEQKIWKKCEDKNYVLLETFVYKNNKQKIHVKCNIDGYDWKPTIERFINNKSSCSKCNTINISKKIIKSFEKDAYDKVYKRCAELNYIIKDFKYEGFDTKLNLKCNLHNFSWNSTTYGSFINQNTICPKCSGKYRLTQEESEELVLNRCNEMNYTLLKPFIFIGVDNTILNIKCNKDKHIWKSTFTNFITKKRCCAKCSGNLKITQVEAEYNVLQRCKDENYILLKPFKYERLSTRIYLKCNKDGHEWNSSYENFINGYGCPVCKSSKGEKKIKKILENNNVSFIRQKIFKYCKYINYLRFDFYIPEYNMCIEYDGEQHFIPYRFKKGNETLKIIKKRDKIKNKYCLDNKINLFRIRYDENIEEKMKEIFKKINQKILL